MNLDKRLENVAVIGAGGKMGSGISYLLTREMVLQHLHPGNKNKTFKLTLMDVSADALEGLRKYLTKQCLKYLGKQQEKLAATYPALAGKDAEAKMTDALDAVLNFTTELQDVGHASMVFEAILEKLDLKIRIYRQLKSFCNDQTFFFSNTSSIPLKGLDAEAGLDGRIIGFHFYNPPAVQKLVELIIPDNVAEGLTDLSYQIGKRLGKIIIPSNDLAGFIGNGHFMRDGLHGIAEAEKLTADLGFAGAVYAINRISQDYLLRPMGIFQLIDYVGLDIFQSILKIMTPHFPSETLHSELINQLVEKGIKGGQFSDGSQKDGFLKYEAGRPAAVYDIDSETYLPIDSLRERVESYLGNLPDNHAPWKALLKDEDRQAKLAGYFQSLAAMDSSGARLAKAYLQRSREIGQLLLDGGVANSADDVNGVLMNGFFHLYGPLNDYMA